MRLNRVGLIAAAVLGGLLVASTVAVAQEKGEGKGKKGGFSVEDRLDRIDKAVTLTDDQKPKVKAVLEDTDKKSQEIRRDSSLSREDRMAKMQPIMDAQDKKLKEILTADQYKKYEEMPRPGRGGKGKKGEGEKKKTE